MDTDKTETGQGCALLKLAFICVDLWFSNKQLKR